MDKIKAKKIIIDIICTTGCAGVATLGIAMVTLGGAITIKSAIAIGKMLEPIENPAQKAGEWAEILGGISVLVVMIAAPISWKLRKEWEPEDVSYYPPIQNELPTQTLIENKRKKHPTCEGCKHYNGSTWGGNYFVCGMHPYGPNEKCEDWENQDFGG